MFLLYYSILFMCCIAEVGRTIQYHAERIFAMLVTRERITSKRETLCISCTVPATCVLPAQYHVGTPVINTSTQ